VQGVSLIYGSRSTPLRIETTFHDGANSKNTDFRDQEPSAIPGNPPIFDENFGFGGRVEYKAFGEWPDYRDVTAKGTKAPLLVFGSGFDFTEAGDTNVFLPTADAQYENPNGFGAYAALHGALTNTSDNDRFDYGGLIQASYLFTPAWELFGRYNAVFTDSPGNDVFSEATVGVNYYFGPNGSYVHRAKFTLDLNYLPNGAPLNITQIDALAGSENQFIVRAQLTLQL
jgi:hypothetical protein